MTSSRWAIWMGGLTLGFGLALLGAGTASADDNADSSTSPSSGRTASGVGGGQEPGEIDSSPAGASSVVPNSSIGSPVVKLGSEPTSLVGNGREPIDSDMFDQMAEIMKLQQVMRDQTRSTRDADRERQMADLDAQVQKMQDEADWQMQAGIISGATSIASGAMSLVGGASSLPSLANDSGPDRISAQMPDISPKIAIGSLPTGLGVGSKITEGWQAPDRSEVDPQVREDLRRQMEETLAEIRAQSPTP